MPEEQDAAAQKSAAQKPATKKSADERKAADKPVVAQPAPAAADRVEESPAADNPLHKKLGLRPGTAGAIIAPPQDSDNPLLPLPDGFSTLAQIDDLASIEGPLDYVHVFARDRAELAGGFSLLRDKLAPAGSLWISWISQSSRQRAGGMVGDLNENIIRRIALTHAMVDVKVAALDRGWSALRLVHRKH